MDSFILFKTNGIFVTGAKDIKQDKLKEIRYTKNKDLNDKIAKDFLNRNVKLTAVAFIFTLI